MDVTYNNEWWSRRPFQCLHNGQMVAGDHARTLSAVRVRWFRTTKSATIRT